MNCRIISFLLLEDRAEMDGIKQLFLSEKAKTFEVRGRKAKGTVSIGIAGLPERIGCSAHFRGCFSLPFYDIKNPIHPR